MPAMRGISCFGDMDSDAIMSDENKVTFKASMPAIDSAIRASGAGNGMRLQLDIPENQMADAAWLLSMRQRRLIVTIEVEQDEKETANKTKPTIKRTRAKRRASTGTTGGNGTPE